MHLQRICVQCDASVFPDTKPLPGEKASFPAPLEQGQRKPLANNLFAAAHIPQLHWKQCVKRFHLRPAQVLLKLIDPLLPNNSFLFSYTQKDSATRHDCEVKIANQ